MCFEGGLVCLQRHNIGACACVKLEHDGMAACSQRRSPLLVVVHGPYKELDQEEIIVSIVMGFILYFVHLLRWFILEGVDGMLAGRPSSLIAYLRDVV